MGDDAVMPAAIMSSMALPPGASPRMACRWSAAAACSSSSGSPWNALWYVIGGGLSGGAGPMFRGLHSLPFQLNLSLSVHRMTQTNS